MELEEMNKRLDKSIDELRDKIEDIDVSFSRMKKRSNTLMVLLFIIVLVVIVIGVAVAKVIWSTMIQ